MSPWDNVPQHLDSNVAKTQLTTLPRTQPPPPAAFIISEKDPTARWPTTPPSPWHTPNSPAAPESYLIPGLDSPLTWLAHLHPATRPYIP